MTEAIFLEGENVVLTPLGRADVNERYLSWLNDEDVLRWRGPKAFPTTLAQLEAWIDGLPAKGDLVLAIRERRLGRHIGNIALNSIQWVHRNAELSIMIGAKDVWGQGVGTEAISLLTNHGFRAMGLHRLWAESPNPAFNAAMLRLGWIEEGQKRDAFLIDGRFADITCWSILDHEWRQMRVQQ